MSVVIGMSNTHIHTHKHMRLQPGTDTYIHVFCVRVLCVCSLHFYTCSRFSFFHASRTFLPNAFGFYFYTIFCTFLFQRLLATWNYIFFLLFLCLALPARTISKVPMCSNVLDKLKERKVKSAQQQQQPKSSRVAAAPICVSYVVACWPCVNPRRSLRLAIRDALSLSLRAGALPPGASGGHCWCFCCYTMDRNANNPNKSLIIIKYLMIQIFHY